MTLRFQCGKHRRPQLLFFLFCCAFLPACDTPSQRAKKLPATPYKKAVDKAQKLKKKVKKYADKIEKLAK